MSPIAIERAISSIAWLGLVHGLWLGLAAPSLAALVLRVRPGLPLPVRHALLLGAFLLATIGPFVVAAAHREVARRSARRPVSVAMVPVTPMTAAAVRPVILREPRPIGPVRPNVRARVARVAEAASPWIMACWASGLTGMIGLVGLGVCSSRRLLRQCRPAPRPVGREALRLGRAMGMRRCPPVLVHDSVGEPCLCGIIRPAIVLPTGWPDEARPGVVSAVLAHELAHARKLDPLTHLIHRFLEALVLFHPGARRLSHSLRLQREHRADALAVRLTGDPRALAEALEGFARFRLAPRRQGPIGAALGGESSALLPRIQEILGMKSEPEHISRWPVVTLPVAGLLALVIVSSGLAREVPAAKAAAAPRPEAAAPQDIEGMAEAPLISYEVQLLEVDDPIDIDFDFEAGDAQRPVPIAFLSDLEQKLLIGSVSRSPSGWMIRAPKVTAFEGAMARIMMPQEPGRKFDEDAPAICVEVSGRVNVMEAREYVRLSISIRLTQEGHGAARRGPNGDAAQEVTCTLPSGGIVMLSADDPAKAAARGRERLILVTPRTVPMVKEKKQVEQPEPVRGSALPHPPRMP